MFSREVKANILLNTKATIIQFWRKQIICPNQAKKLASLRWAESHPYGTWPSDGIIWLRRAIKSRAKWRCRYSRHTQTRHVFALHEMQHTKCNSWRRRYRIIHLGWILRITPILWVCAPEICVIMRLCSTYFPVELECLRKTVSYKGNRNKGASLMRLTAFTSKLP